MRILTFDNRTPMHKGWMIFLLALAMVLGGCLPDESSVRERQLAEFAATQAASYAASLSSFAVQSQGNFAASLAVGLPPPGLQGYSDNNTMAYGFCTLSGDVANHIIVSWLASEDNQGNFSIKGLGTGTGASIVHELARRAPPDSIGYYSSGDIRLRGPRRDGETVLTLPGGCNLPIPEGAPVILAENMAVNNAQLAQGDNYEYQTVSCDDANDIGARTQRRSVTTEANGSVTRGAWEDYDTTCNGQVSVRSVEITGGTTSNLIGALSGAPGKLQSALSSLQGVDCVSVNMTTSEEDENGNVIETDETIANSCDTDEVGLVRYTGPSLAEQTTDIESTERADVQCGGEPAGSRMASVVYSGRSLPGTMTYGTWDGLAVYMRHVYQANVDASDTNADDRRTGVRGQWVGDTLNCTRPESLNIACTEAYPAYGDTSIYTPVDTGGLTLGRTNRIDGWQDAVALTPNPPLGANDGWTRSAVDCSWDEIRIFSECPEGFTLVSPGRNLRRHSISPSEQVIVGEWRADTPLQCRRITEEVQQC